jgi:hypothetical protein
LRAISCTFTRPIFHHLAFPAKRLPCISGVNYETVGGGTRQVIGGTLQVRQIDRQYSSILSICEDCGDIIWMRKWKNGGSEGATPQSIVRLSAVAAPAKFASNLLPVKTPALQDAGAYASRWPLWTSSVENYAQTLLGQNFGAIGREIEDGWILVGWVTLAATLLTRFTRRTSFSCLASIQRVSGAYISPAQF